jgi:2-oxoglutarate dehydrogenase E1 component
VFDYGYAANQNALTIWEAQFGDFSMGSKVMILTNTFLYIKMEQPKRNCFIITTRYEGQGAEHSSARMERS